ncbi:pirin family protein [Sedimentimonas flavescens]|uniref:Pirin family protein n=1 Tax=Sedimentimonas flavescens TaxID=2851012 RepID=A0ABT3A090_9RHOB|nr:pirin family protein [Sedimentimonas flavescens]MCV2879427.1 pirin family protein [Sedimentimonas flavescens]
MSWNPLLDPRIPIGDSVDAIETVIVPRARDLGGFEVRRALPSAKRQMVGPFIFFDQFGPVEFLSGQGIDVRPHPHIGLATVTYLFAGRLHHRDSLGSDQWITPGAVNWMSAGHGITHSERTDSPVRESGQTLSGVQIWVALPQELEDGLPSFDHVPSAEQPLLEAEGKKVRLVLGDAWGARTPLDLPSEMFMADAALEPRAALPLPDNHEDRAVYVLSGVVEVAGQRFEPGRLLIFRPGDQVALRTGEAGARILLLGGATLEGPRYIWWNFVASSKDRIEAAKEAWRAGDWTHGRFQLPPGDDAEFIPAPPR